MARGSAYRRQRLQEVRATFRAKAIDDRLDVLRRVRCRHQQGIRRVDDDDALQAHDGHEAAARGVHEHIAAADVDDARGLLDAHDRVALSATVVAQR